METKKIVEAAEQLHGKYRDYMDFFESNSPIAKVRSLTNEDYYAFGKQLENYEAWQSFVETNGGQGDLGVLPNIAMDRQVA